jgi:hypothetical protein
VAALQGEGAIAQGAGAQAVSKGVAVAGDSTAPIDNSTHIHIGAPGEAAKALKLRNDYLRRMLKQSNAVSLLASSSDQRPLQLASVYTALMTERLELGIREAEHGVSGKVQMELDMRTTRRLSAVAVLDAATKLVLLGGPGRAAAKAPS